jgi:tetrachlorobenzoquinone reductase
MDNQPFAVFLEKSNKRYQIPADASILDILELEGHTVPSSCTEGVCGTCETKVLNGDIDHRDMVLTAIEKKSNQCMMICVSRAKSGELVLDL